MSMMTLPLDISSDSKVMSWMSPNAARKRRCVVYMCVVCRGNQGGVSEGVCGVPYLPIVRSVLNVTVWPHKHIKGQRKRMIIL